MDLFIDDNRFTLGAMVDSTILKNDRYHKIGLVRRLFTGKGAGRVRYTVENPSLSAIDKDFTIYPCTDRYLDEDRRWRTHATLVVREDRLCEVLFQVLDGRYAAGNFLDRFVEACHAVLGEPVEAGKRASSWHHRDYALTAQLLEDGFRSDFRFSWTGS